MLTCKIPAFWIQTALFILILNSCTNIKQEKIESRIDAELNNLTTRIPQLSGCKEDTAKCYKLIRRIEDHNNNFEIRLYANSDHREIRNEIITVSTREGKVATVPILPNIYRDYWLFCFYSPDSTQRRIHSTFYGELVNAIDSLNVSGKTGFKIIYEIFRSILQCDPFYNQGDISSFQPTRINRPEWVCEDSCMPYLGKINTALSETLNKRRTSYNHSDTIPDTVYQVFWDSRHRIYELKHPAEINNKFEFDLKTYRYECDCRPAFLISKKK